MANGIIFGYVRLGDFTFYSPVLFADFVISMYFILQSVKTMMLYPFCKNNRAKQGPSSLLQWSMTLSVSDGKNRVHCLDYLASKIHLFLWTAQGTVLFGQYVWCIKPKGLEFKFCTCPILAEWVRPILISLCLYFLVKKRRQSLYLPLGLSWGVCEMVNV